MKPCIFLFAFLSSSLLFSQNHSHQSNGALSFPDVPGYKTLTTDFHQHTVFSDGSVWPNIRIMEALRDDLDAVSMTEHLEYQPHSKDIPHPDRNRAYEIALAEAKNHELMVIAGSEITRDAPVGHSNAIFITDANKLIHDKAEDAFAAAKEQGAFVFWNHPAWYPQNPNGNPKLSDFQKERIKNGELHGIEVINDGDYAEESLALALEQNLTIMGTSDIHGLIDWHFKEEGHSRPITLVLAKERSKASIKEALFAGRTVAVFDDLMVGKAENLNPLLKASVQIESATYINNTSVLQVKLKNNTSCDLLFENEMPYTFYSNAPVFTLKAKSSTTLQIKTLEQKEVLTLKLKALRAYVAPKVHPVIEWQVNVKSN